ncbi:chemotaxis protein CheW [Phenylobacterium sp. LH3H17]|nr:chemotaxis protein CheW [Phenylobacterium sp. LH3H17]UTP38322.1 chemotaxis protein CheW [Phenylobacterium sp. LH3H17]
MVATDLPAAGAELITVRIGDQQFAIDIMSVREIRGWAPSTPLPNAPPYVRGMINLRGAILPVVDLGARLGLAPTMSDRSSVVVVAEVAGRQMGLLVDAVCDILLLTADMLQEAPDVGAEIVRDFVRAVMTTEAGIVTLISLDKILPSGGVASTRPQGASGATVPDDLVLTIG